MDVLKTMMEIKGLCWLLISTSTLLNLANVKGDCALPHELRGNWISSDRGILNFTDNAIQNYPVVIFGTPRPFTMRCMESRNNLYMFKADGQFWSLHLFTCLEFHAVSDVKMWYHHATEYDSDRETIVIASNTTTLESVCNRRRPFAISSFNSLVKEGSFENVGYPGVLCPSDLHQTFSQGTLRSGTAVCSDNFFDVCGNRNRTEVRLNYGPACGALLKRTGGESYVCLMAFTSSNRVTYLHLYDNVIKKINCLAYKVTDTSLKGTLFPGSCWDNETDTYAGPGGIYMGFINATKTCEDIHVIKPSPIGLYAGIAACVLVLILILIGTVYCIYKAKCRFIKRLYTKTKIGNSEEIFSNDSAMLKDVSTVMIPELHPPTRVELFPATMDVNGLR